jgi:hypothetical protein
MKRDFIRKIGPAFLAFALLTAGLSGCGVKTGGSGSAAASATASSAAQLPGLPAITGGSAEDRAPIAKMGEYALETGDFKFYFYGILNQVVIQNDMLSSTAEQKAIFWSKTSPDGTLSNLEYYKSAAMMKLRQQTMAAIRAVESGYTVTQALVDVYADFFNGEIAGKYGGSRADADAGFVKQYAVNIERYTRILYVQALAQQFLNDVYAKMTKEEKDAENSANDEKYKLTVSKNIYDSFLAPR